VDLTINNLFFATLQNTRLKVN